MNTVTTTRHTSTGTTQETACIDIVAVHRIALPKGWRFEAEMADGSRQVIRAKATRAYDLAHLHSGRVCTGKSGLGAVVCFGQKPSTYAPLVRTFRVEAQAVTP